MEQIQTVVAGLGQALTFLVAYWWIYTPLLLFFAVMETYRAYTRTGYMQSLKWVLLEVTPPPDVPKSPKIAENLFSALHAIYIGGTSWKKMFFEGKVPDWFSLEIVANQGIMRFYIRSPEGLRNLVEAQIFAQYPDAQVSVADDYVNQLPRKLPNEEYDLFGTELIFTKEDAYPIKTYPDFEEKGGEDEHRWTDPLAPLAEVMSTVGPGEHVWVQMVVRPTGGDWVKEGQKIVDELIGKKQKAEPGFFEQAVTAIDSLIPGSVPSEPKKEEKESSMMNLTPGQRLVLEKVEMKMSKLGFKAGIRFLYVARKDAFNRARISGTIGMFKQLYSNNLNTFKPNGAVSTFSRGILYWLFPSDRGFFAAMQEYERKYRIYQQYRIRAFVRKYVILNTEELATLWHLPGLNVKAPGFPRVEAKTGQPPAGLPTQ